MSCEVYGSDLTCILDFSKVKVFKLKESGMLDTVHSSGWKYLDFSPDQEKTIIQLGGGVGGAQRVQRQTSTESVQSSSATPLTPQRSVLIDIDVVQRFLK